MRRTFQQWAECLHFAQPETLVRWHRKGFKYYWKRKSTPKKPGRAMSPISGWTVARPAPPTASE
jgi:hypothetical protein